jgi:hypothetical protein
LTPNGRLEKRKSIRDLAMSPKCQKRASLASFVRHVSITITPSVHRLERHLVDKPLSTGRLSEYPTDYFVGICIETTAMAEQNTLWLPRVDFPNCRLRLLPLEE